jgi:hypothetical protein
MKGLRNRKEGVPIRELSIWLEVPFWREEREFSYNARYEWDVDDQLVTFEDRFLAGGEITSEDGTSSEDSD